METEKIKIKQLMSYINKDLSSKVLFLGVSKKTKGDMTAVLVSCDKYIENMRFIPTWKLGNKAVKSWYALQALVRIWFLLTFDKRIKKIGKQWVYYSNTTLHIFSSSKDLLLT